MTNYQRSRRGAGSIAALLAITSMGAAFTAEGRAASQVQQPIAVHRGESVRQVPPANLLPSTQLDAATRALDSRIRSLGEAFPGHVGIAVRDVQTGWTTAFDGNGHFPQQSVSKFWVALTALDKADRGELDLNREVTVKREDLTLFHQPIRAAVLRNGGYTTTLGNLMFKAITESDNTANDVVLRRAGGSDAVRDFLREKAINGVRFGPGERLLQSRIAGVSWRPEFSIGNNFYAARNRVPAAERRNLFNQYVADPIDGATPLGIVGALARLKKGELLSPPSTQRLLGIMSNTKTGKQRLRGGLAPGWSCAHKTGTGQVFQGQQAGYNDIGILTAPNGRSYAVAVMIGRTSAPLGQRMQLMQNVVKAVIDYENNLRT